MPIDHKAHGRSPEALAVIAAWLEEPSHLRRTPLEDFLCDRESVRSLYSVSGYFQLETTVEDSLTVSREGNAASAEAESVIEQAATPHWGSARRARTGDRGRPSENINRNTSTGGSGQSLPNQLRHRGVERLLSEYYKMVENAKYDAGNLTANKYKPSLKDSLSKLLFPPPPSFLEVKSLVGYTQAAFGLLASVTVQLIFVVLPIWLYFLRQFRGKGANWVIITFLAFSGILFLYLAEQMHLRKKLKRSKGCTDDIRAFYIGADGKMPEESHSFLAVVARCQTDNHNDSTAVRHARGRGSMGGTVQENGSTSSQDAFGASDTILAHSDVARSAEDVVREVNIVKIAVQGERFLQTQSNGSGLAALRNEIKRLSESVGVDCPIGCLRSTASMLLKLKQLREIVGC